MRRRGATFSTIDREIFRLGLIERDGSVCLYCGTTLGLYNYHIDHKTPIIKGGAHRDLDNLALACMQCNQEKHNKDVEEYREWRRKNGLKVHF
jgi:5-methylcytosine-specific restriction endonuclease McrA